MTLILEFDIIGGLVERAAPKVKIRSKKRVRIAAENEEDLQRELNSARERS